MTTRFRISPAAFLIPVILCCGLLAMAPAQDEEAPAKAPAPAQQEEAPEKTGLPDLLGKVGRTIVIIESITQVQDRRGGLREVVGYNFGVIVDPEGMVITDGGIYFEGPRYSKPKNIVVTLSTGDEIDAEFLGKDDETDLGFLQLVSRDEPYPWVDFSKAATVELGEEVVVFGTLPRSYQFERKFILTRVNALITRPKPMLSLMNDVSDSISGPVFTPDGVPVGLVSTETRGSSRGSRSFVLPAGEFLKLLDDPPKVEEKESKAWLGISFQVLNEKLAEVMGIPGRKGVVVNRVYPGMPGAKAGIQIDDAIVEMGGKEIAATRADEDSEIFIKMIREQEIGAALPLKVFREGKEMELVVTLQERPKSPSEAKRYNARELGLIVREITFFDTVDLSLEPDEEGVMVHAVEPALPAGLARVQVEDVVKEVSGQGVTGLEGFKEIMQAAAGKDVVLFVRRDHQTKFIQITFRGQSRK